MGISNTILSVSQIRMTGKSFSPTINPAYITWEEFEENPESPWLHRTNTERCGPAREGAALLTGILICGKCGRRMTVPL